MDNLDNLLETVYERYFNTLSAKGYLPVNVVARVLILLLINKSQTLFEDYLTDEDKSALSKALFCLYNHACVIPFPSNCSNINIE